MITNYTNTNFNSQSSTLIFDLPLEAVCEPGYEDGTWDYDVIVHTHEDLHSLYHDLEEEAVTPPGLDIMRPVECINRWPSSRATTFRLTPEEAQRLTQDPRVLEIELNERHLGHQTVTQVRRQFSDSWSKDSNYISTATEKNWALYRCLVTDEPYNDWVYYLRTLVTATIELTMTGKNVDIVIVDNNEIEWQHPEFAPREDGLGASRLNYYNWRQHWPAVFGLPEGTYPLPYQYALSQNPAYTLAQRISLWQQTSAHPTHVAGIAAGNTQGWASDANIYHISFNSSRKFALIRQFHKNKPINPVTGRRNPTIVNNSWLRGILSSSYPNLFDPGSVQTVTYRGVTYTGVQYDGLSVTQTGFYTWFGDVAESYGRFVILSTFGPLRNTAVKMDPRSSSNQRYSQLNDAANPWARIRGTSGLTASTQPTSGNNDQGYWTVNLPFQISMGQSNKVNEKGLPRTDDLYSQAYVSTKGYITFDAPSTTSTNFSTTNPEGAKLMWNAGDRSVQRIYYGVSNGGVSPNREFTIRIEGNNVNTGTLGSPGMLVEVTFFESNNDVAVIFGANNGITQDGLDFTRQMLIDYGIYNTSAATDKIGIRNAADDADIQDCINDGIIIVGGAGNEGLIIDVPGGIDYNNSFTTVGYISGTPIYYNRGPSPGAVPNVICVGAIGTQSLPMPVAGFSNVGPRVDIFAPGENIMSSVIGYWGGASTDTRKTTTINTLTGPYFENFYVGKMNGTSMSGPQVTGVLACLMEVYPDITQSEALSYITTSHVTLNKINNNYGSLKGAPNRFLFYNAGEKTVVGPVVPKVNYKTRPRSGPTFPRTRQGPRSKPQ